MLWLRIEFRHYEADQEMSLISSANPTETLKAVIRDGGGGIDQEKGKEFDRLGDQDVFFHCHPARHT